MLSNECRISAFFGSVNIANPRSDLSLFSFGGIKNATSFGGAIAKFKDPVIFQKVMHINAGYPVQPTTVRTCLINQLKSVQFVFQLNCFDMFSQNYMKKLLKYSIAYCLVNEKFITKNGFRILRAFNYGRFTQRAISLHSTSSVLHWSSMFRVAASRYGCTKAVHCAGSRLSRSHVGAHPTAALHGPTSNNAASTKSCFARGLPPRQRQGFYMHKQTRPSSN